MSAFGMPPFLLALFEARSPLKQVERKPQKVPKGFGGFSDFIAKFETEEPPPVEPFENPKELRERLKLEKAQEHDREISKFIAKYDPFADEAKKTADPAKTLFLGRLSFETGEKKLLKTFEPFGRVKDIRIVKNKEGRPRGYAFIEFETREGARNALHGTATLTLDGRKVLVDFERARVVAKWLPRRLGGGQGPPRRGISKKVLRERALEKRARKFEEPGSGGTESSGHYGPFARRRDDRDSHRTWDDRRERGSYNARHNGAGPYGSSGHTDRSFSRPPRQSFRQSSNSYSNDRKPYPRDGRG